MKLTVIMVNYNQCNLLKQTLNSLIVAGKGIDYEVIIVDNASCDKSIEMLAYQFPQFQVLANQVNEGIPKAYNRAIELATGEYILLVNADTICGKDTLDKVLEFMDAHSDASGTGVRMLSPQGKFLSESKRGLTKPWIAFFKLVGLARQFPKSRLSNRNRKEWVEEFQTTEVDILNGAFMLLRRSVFNETGLLDERFVRFGYDIDLSYRMKLAGLKNYYFPKTYIINYKTQPIPKFSWQYIKYFYGAMFIFAAKYLFKVPEIKVQGMRQVFKPQYEVEQ
jgi:GT2 family glycosyltransferase